MMTPEIERGRGAARLHSREIFHIFPRAKKEEEEEESRIFSPGDVKSEEGKGEKCFLLPPFPLLWFGLSPPSS